MINLGEVSLQKVKISKGWVGKSKQKKSQFWELCSAWAKAEH